MSHPDVIIAGLGTMGAAAAMALTGAGKRVLAFDRFAPPHGLSEHGGRQRMFRMSYYEHVDYVPLLVRAREMWLALGAETDREIYRETGAVYVGRRSDELIVGSLRAARQHGIEHEEVMGEELRRRWAGFAIDADTLAVWERRAGYLRCEDAVSAMIASAGQGGRLEAHADEPVVSWTAGADGVEVRTERGVYHAGALVLCAGPWSGELLESAGVPLQVTRQVQAWTRPLKAGTFAEGVWPCWAMQVGAEALLYGFPLDAATGFMKVAVHARGEVVEPGRVERTVSDSDLERLRALLARHVPRAGEISEASVCMYTNSPDSHFVIDRHPAHPNVALACGFSGHGFKFAPAVGEVIEQLLRSPASKHPTPFLGIGRLRTGAQ